ARRGAGQAGGRGAGRVGAVPVRAVEGAGVAHPALEVLEGAPVDEVEIEKTVTVVVEEADAAALGLEDVVLLRPAARVLELDPRRRGDVREGGERGRCCRRRGEDE